MARTISTTDSILDSRDIDARIDDLRIELDAAHQCEREELTFCTCAEPAPRIPHGSADAECIECGKDYIDQSELPPVDFEDWIQWVIESPNGHEMSSEAEEFRMWCEMRDDCGSAEWSHGLTLIHDSYFQDYAIEFAEDIGVIDRDASWPNNYIDWERAADALQSDYSCVEVDGETYWYKD